MTSVVMMRILKIVFSEGEVASTKEGNQERRGPVLCFCRFGDRFDQADIGTYHGGMNIMLMLMKLNLGWLVGFAVMSIILFFFADKCFWRVKELAKFQ